MALKKFLALAVIIFLICVSCYSGNHFVLQAQKNYNDFIKGYKSIITSGTNYLSVDDSFYVELKTGAVPYLWDYTLSGDSVKYIDEASFNLSRPGLVGAPVQYIWRFKCAGKGSAVITYSYRSIVRKDEIVKTNTYTLIIN